MTGNRGGRHLQHVCVDQHTEFVPGEAANRGGAELFHVEVYCAAGILCLPYTSTKEITCAVCTK